MQDTNRWVRRLLNLAVSAAVLSYCLNLNHEVKFQSQIQNRHLKYKTSYWSTINQVS